MPDLQTLCNYGKTSSQNGCHGYITNGVHTRNNFVAVAVALH